MSGTPETDTRHPPRASASTPTRIVFAGTAGGVGTTTVTALLFAAMAGRPAGAPTLTDHSAGVLGARLPFGDESVRVDDSLVLHDLGPHARGEGIDLIESPKTLIGITTAATPAGIALGVALLDDIIGRYGKEALARVNIIASQTSGRHDIAAETRRLFATYGRAVVHRIPEDPALATGGRIPLNRLRRPTREAQSRLARHLDGLAGHFR